MQDKDQAIKKLYDISKKANVPAPKRSLFSVKCPKCGCKLEKRSEKSLIVPGSAGTELANEAARDLSLGEGAFNLTVDYFKCNCGYEYAKTTADVLSD